MTQDEGEGFILEFRRIGPQVKATAIDPVTGREASIIGPASLPARELGALAAKKLRYVLRKQ